MKETDTPDQGRSPDDRSIPDPESKISTSTDLSHYARNLPDAALDSVRVFRNRYGTAYIQIGNQTTVYRLDGPQAQTLLLRRTAEAGKFLRHQELRELIDSLRAYVQLSVDVQDVWQRVAPIQHGVGIDLGDDAHSRVQITPGNVAIVREGSTSLFHRPSTMRAMVMPADKGDLRRLDLYLNLTPSDVVLLKAWLSYTLAHAKIKTSAFPLLILGGAQGSGKSFLCRLIQALVDPSSVGVQSFPRTDRDLAIAAEHCHVLLYDNVREIRPYMADALCIAATGGSLATRRLFSDAELVSLRLHSAVVLNGIHAFIDQPDLAQRCVPLTLRPLDEKRRRTEMGLTCAFETHLPIIFRGLLDLIANVLAHLPRVESIHPERMIAFSNWLAAMERVDDVPEGIYQDAYSTIVSDGMLDNLVDNPVGAAVLALGEDRRGERWSGTPSELLSTLDALVGRRAASSREWWPQNPIALSKQLRSLEAGLRRQGVEIRLSRARERRITITFPEGPSHE